MSARYHKDLLSRVQEAAAVAASTEGLMQHIADLLHGEVARFNWVGFYVLSRSEGMLILARFTGSFTPLQRVPLDKGLCGSAASLARSVVVNDVSADPRYLVASGLVKSEMVAPVLARGKVVAEIDVNSYFTGTFGTEEQQLVNSCAAVVGKYFEKGR